LKRWRGRKGMRRSMRTTMKTCRKVWSRYLVGRGWLTTPLHCTLLTLEPDTSVREEEPLLGPQGWA
jgi:hypothetical protein